MSSDRQPAAPVRLLAGFTCCRGALLSLLLTDGFSSGIAEVTFAATPACGALARANRASAFCCDPTAAVDTAAARRTQVRSTRMIGWPATSALSKDRARHAHSCACTHERCACLRRAPRVYGGALRCGALVWSLVPSAAGSLDNATAFRRPPVCLIDHQELEQPLRPGLAGVQPVILRHARSFQPSNPRFPNEVGWWFNSRLVACQAAH
jgi:hypothetical protein